MISSEFDSGTFNCLVFLHNGDLDLFQYDQKRVVW